MNFQINQKAIQTVVAYAAIVFGVLTQSLSGIDLPTTASAILGAFGILLHPGTSITSPTPSSSTKADVPGA